MSNLDNYTTFFYQNQLVESKKSAKVILPIIEELFSPKSIIDIGCGVGAWLCEWKEIDNDKIIHGIDAGFVNKSMLLIESSKFQEVDLTKKLHLQYKSELAMCLEVAEHLPEERAISFISELTQLSDVILFSAAVPGQGGTHHINEQYLSYWIPIFKSNGFDCFDIIRPQIWNNEKILWWYRQNIVIFVRQGNVKTESLNKLETFHGYDLIHKQLLTHKTNKYNNSIAQTSKLLKNPFFYLKSIFNGFLNKFK
jgi:hypothetical protein